MVMGPGFIKYSGARACLNGPVKYTISLSTVQDLTDGDMEAIVGKAVTCISDAGTDKLWDYKERIKYSNSTILARNPCIDD